MKATERLATWLAGKTRDYKEGVKIFVDLNIDITKIEFFNSGSDRFHQNILTRQLENYARVNGIKPKVYIDKPSVHKIQGKLKSQSIPNVAKLDAKASKFERPLIDTNPSVKFDELPEDLQIKFKETSQFNNEIKSLHATLKLIQDDPEKEPERKEIAQGMIDRQKQIRENWDAIDKWWNDQKKEPAGEKEKSAEELAAEKALEKDKRIKANLNYIRRYKDTTKAKQKQELELRKKELDDWGVSYDELLQ